MAEKTKGQEVAERKAAVRRLRKELADVEQECKRVWVIAEQLQANARTLRDALTMEEVALRHAALAKLEEDLVTEDTTVRVASATGPLFDSSSAPYLPYVSPWDDSEIA